VIPRRGDLVITRWGARYLGRRLPCAIGKAGIKGDKREGDGATPAGNWRLVGGAFRADRMAPLRGNHRTAMPMHRIGHTDIWSDDPADPAYNHRLARTNHSFSHERLHRGDPLYDLILMTDHNWPYAVPGNGSAIFLHRWRKPRHPTAGCIAFAPEDLRWIVRTWRPRSRLIIKPCVPPVIAHTHYMYGAASSGSGCG